MTVAATAATAEAPRYRRLPGRTRGLMGSSSLWLAGDHVLLVQSRGYVESYRRFYFRDVQAILLRRTAAAWVSASVLAVLLALIGAGAAVADGAGQVALLIAAGAFALALLIHLVRGASCVCHVSTAVERTELTALRRLRTARKTCERLRALVEEVQGRVAVETLARGAPGNPDAIAPPPLRAASETGPAPDGVPAGQGATQDAHGPRSEPGIADTVTSPRALAAAVDVSAELSGPAPGFGAPGAPRSTDAPAIAGAGPAAAALASGGGAPGRSHVVLFSLLLADTALSTAQVVIPGQMLDAAALLLGIVEFLVAIAALVDGRRARVDAELRRAGVASLVYVCGAFVAGWFTSVVGGIQAAFQGKAPQPALSSEWLAMISIPVTAALALWGFFALRRARRTV